MPLFTGYDSDQLMSQIQQYMIEKGYWNDQIWATDSGQLILRLMSELIAVNNYSVNRVYEESFEETARRLDTTVQALHRKGFDFNKVLENNIRKFEINSQAGSFHAITQVAFQTPPPAYKLTVNFSGRLVFRRVSMVESYQYLFNFKEDWYSINNDVVEVISYVPLSQCRFVREIAYINAGWYREFTLSSSDINLIIAESTLTKIIESTKTFSISALNYELIVSNILRIMELIVDTSEIVINKNRYENLDFPKCYLSVAESGKPSMLFEEFSIGSAGEIRVLENSSLVNSIKTDNTEMTDAQRQYWFEADEYAFVKVDIFRPEFATGYYIVDGIYDPTSDSYKIKVEDLIYDTDLTLRRVQCTFTGSSVGTVDLSLYVHGLFPGLFECTEATNTTFRLRSNSYAISGYGDYVRTVSHNLYVNTTTLDNVFDVASLKAFLKTKLFSNNALVSVGDINTVLAQINGIVGSNSFQDGGLKICIHPDTIPLRDVVNGVMSGSFFPYTFATTQVLDLVFKGVVYHDGTLEPAEFSANYTKVKRFYNETLTFGEVLQTVKSNNTGVIDIIGRIYHGFYYNEFSTVNINVNAGVDQELFELIFPDRPAWTIVISDIAGNYQNAGVSIVWSFTKATGALAMTLNWVNEAVPFYVLLGRNNASLQTKNNEIMLGRTVLAEFIA